MGRYRNVTILAAAIFLQIVGLAVQVKRRSENQSTRLIRVWTVAAVTPLEKNIVRVQTGLSGLWNNYLYLRGVRQQNRELQDQIQQLQLEQVRLRQDAEQARRLQSLLGFKEQFIDKTTAAQVIGSSGSEQSRIVYLDKGTADGITPDMAVISAQGIVGKVIQVFRHTSQVLLINDQTSGVGTILERSRLQGVLKGRATGELVLDKIMTEEDVQSGDRILTSGGDQIFPKGLPVGVVANVSRGGEFLQVRVRPAASLNHLEEVLVITKKQEREPAVATSAPARAADILSERLPSVPDKPEQPATAASANSTGTAPAKVKPQAATASASGANSRPTAPGAGAQASTTLPKPPSATVPHTQTVGLVQPNTAAQTTTDAPSKPNASASATTPANAPSQNATSALSKAAGNDMASTAAATTNKTGAGSWEGKAKPTVPANSAGKANVAGSPATPAKTPAPPTQTTKPLKPATSAPKPAASPQPSTQPDSGDTPQ